jgi:hypothetical protein
MIHTKPKVYLATFKSPKCREKKKTLWRQTLVALFFINGNFYQLITAKEIYKRQVRKTQKSK